MLLQSYFMVTNDSHLFSDVSVRTRFDCDKLAFGLQLEMHWLCSMSSRLNGINKHIVLIYFLHIQFDAIQLYGQLKCLHSAEGRICRPPPHRSASSDLAVILSQIPIEMSVFYFPRGFVLQPSERSICVFFPVSSNG